MINRDLEHPPRQYRSGVGQALARIIVGGEPLGLKPEEEANISGAETQDKPAILKHTIGLRKGAGRRVALVHVDVVDALPCAKLAIDRPEVGLAMWCGKFSAKDKDLAILPAELHQIVDQNILEIVVGAWPCLRDCNP